MGMIGRFVAVIVAAFVATMIGSAIAARMMKERVVPIDDPSADAVALAAIFGPLDFKSTATAFRGGTVECWYGGGVIDLRGATLAPDGAHLELRAVFGGAQIVVPDDWRVTTRVLGIGGAGDARPAADRGPDAPHLTIEGIAIFGGAGITSSIPEAQAAAMTEAAQRAADREQPAEAPEPVPVA